MRLGRLGRKRCGLDLLGRARNLFKGLGTPPEAKVQYYSVVCPLGHRVRGQRTEGYQALRCPACGEGVFVLPASTLPEPVAPPRSARAHTAVAGGMRVDEGPVELMDPPQATVEIEDPDDRSAEAEIIWDDEAVGGSPKQVAAELQVEPPPGRSPRNPAVTPTGRSPAPAPAGGPSAGGSSRSERTSSRRGRPPDEREPREQTAPRLASPSRRQETRPPAEVGGAAETSTPRIRPARATGRVPRPLLVLACVALLVIGTVVIRSWRARRQGLPQLALAGRTEGIPALEAGQFDKANQLLSAAREAVDSLGGAVEDADEIRHAAEEASIFVNLLSDSLESLLDEASRTSPQAWASRFDTLYKGRSVIIDATITATPETSSTHRYEVDYLVLPAGEGTREPARGRIDLTNLEVITLAQRKVGDRVLFGARLTSFQYDLDAGEWLIRFEPKSGVSIRYIKALETLGWPSGSWLPDESNGATEGP